jgi:hypothetical protein
MILWRCYHAIFLEGLSKITKDLSQYSRSQDNTRVKQLRGGRIQNQQYAYQSKTYMPTCFIRCHSV